ncbi:transposase [Streptomyces sp. NPDC058770]|uniref:transposase n=1 Tax=Streptomyces sp. NPDC058770 TaxID=3346631 RepID=UPI00369EE30B
MGSKYTKRYTEEFKRDAIALVDSSGRTVTAAARELGVSSESLRGWYRRAKADRGEGEPGELTSAEREELKRLRNRGVSAGCRLYLCRAVGDRADRSRCEGRRPGPVEQHPAVGEEGWLR